MKSSTCVLSRMLGNRRRAVGGSAVWVTKVDGTLLRISPTPGLPIEATISLGGVPRDVAIVDRDVWIAYEFGDLVRDARPSRSRSAAR
jgi:hypothetical protein